MAIDERTKRALAVQQLMEKNMDKAATKSITKRRRVPNGTASMVRELMRDTDKGPRMVAFRLPGKSPFLIATEGLVKEVAEQIGGDEEDVARHLVVELHAPGAMAEVGMEPNGLHVGGKLHLSERGRERLRQAISEATGMDVDPEHIGAAIDDLYGGSDEDNAVMIGSRGMYRVAEHTHGPGGRSVLSGLAEGVRGKADDRLPLNITRTVTVRGLADDGKPIPTEDDEDEASVFPKLARRFGAPRRTPERGRRHDD